MESTIGFVAEKALDFYQKQSIRRSQAKAAKREGLRALLTSRNTIRKGFIKSYRKVEKLHKLNIPYLEMPESSLKMTGVKLKKNRKKGEF